MKKIWIFSWAAMLAVVCACTKNDAAEPVPVIRLDLALQGYADLDSVARQQLIDNYRPEVDAFFSVLGYPDPQDPELEWWSRSDEVTMFQPQVDAAFPSLGAFEASLGHIVCRAKADSLPVDGMRFASVVWGKPYPVVPIDSVMLIALNHYLGPEHESYAHMATWRQAEKDPKYMPYDVASALAASTAGEFTTKDAPTVLNNLLYEGALVEARMRLVPDAKLADALGYTSETLAELEAALPDIKTEMAQRRMLYDTDPDLINRLFAGGASSPLLNGAAPGRAGRYVGYTLVHRYAEEHPKATLRDLLSPSFYDNPATLQQIGF
ncbi:MAG: hypothetical protein K2N16_04055 [Muribaculaceae bacterium]|nr:hypothetical protein [Muribaculaceae bacterium]